MIERKLSKTQKRIFVALAQQGQELQEALLEVAEAEREQMEILRTRYELPEGTYKLRQEQNGDVVMYRQADPEPEEKEENPAG
jgi:hypothetical protein